MKCTVAGIYDLRRLQIKRSRRLVPRAVLALDCSLYITKMSIFKFDVFFYTVGASLRTLSYRQFFLS